MSRRWGCALAAALAASSALAEKATTVGELKAARKLARDGDLQGDWNKLVDARARLLRLAGEKEAGARAVYDLGYVDWRLSSLAYLSLGPQGMVPLLERAAAELSFAAEHLDGGDAPALLATVLGFLIGTDPKRAPELGPRAKAAWATALERGPENPRVLLLEAMTTFGKPKQFGGSQERGLELWWEAIARFERSAAATDPAAPDWGHAEAWGWLGGAYLMLGQSAKALEAFDKALQLRHDFWWVERIALPQAKRPTNAN